jgi:hypothetical protein
MEAFWGERQPILRVWLLAVATSLLSITACAPMMKSGAAKQSPSKWRSLLVGDSLNGWTPKIVGYPAGQDPFQTFRARDGVLSVSYEQYGDNLRGRIGHLFTGESFHAYRLSLDYRFTGDELPNTPPANSPVNNGVMFHSESAEQMELNQPYPVSVETQLLGPDPQGTARTTGNFCERGMKMYAQEKLLPHCVLSAIPPPPLGAWTHLEIEVTADGRVSESIDGKPVMKVDRIELNPESTDTRLPLKAVIAAAGGKLLLTGGHIALQSEGHPIEFRNLRILSLE